MRSEEIRTRFLDFFAKRGHTVAPSSSLIPDDPSVLLTTAGMQQFKPYYTGEADPYRSPHPTLDGKPLGSQRATSCQKSFRTSDIDEVGDEQHLTFFEMLGNFSFGPTGSDDPKDFGKAGYFKRAAIYWAHELITKELELKVDYVSIFKGEGGVPRDEESYKIWREINPSIEIREFGRADNFWGPTGNEGPCGPTTEIYVKGIEVWNLVFNEYYQHPDGRLEPIKNPGVDTGMGLERIAAVLQGVSTIFETDLFHPLTRLLPEAGIPDRSRRIIVDHLRSIAFLLADGVRPSNKEAGYVLRRLVRRVLVHEYVSGVGSYHGADTLATGGGFDEITKLILGAVVEHYGSAYPGLRQNQSAIFSELETEKAKFQRTLTNGLKVFARMQTIDAPTAFKLYETYGLPYEVIKDPEVSGGRAKDLHREDFERELKKHQEISRAGAAAKFGGHGLYLKTGELTVRDPSELEKVTRLHTATHLLHAALRHVLGSEVRQNGSDITVERTRFDFTFPRKVTPEELKKVENLVNEKIQEDLPVSFEELPVEEAKKTGALWFFKEKYPPVVKVYSVGDPSTGSGQVFSKEFCGGPHVEHTSQIGRFKIVKEEAVSAGVRRVRAIVEP